MRIKKIITKRLNVLIFKEILPTTTRRYILTTVTRILMLILWLKGLSDQGSNATSTRHFIQINLEKENQ